MTKNEEKLKELGYEDSDILIFSNPYYDGALIHVRDGKAVYDFDLMVQALMEECDMTDIDAIDFISYNAIRSLPYYPNAPIIEYNDEDDLEDISWLGEFE